MLMLAMDINQYRSRFLKKSDRNRLTVDPAYAPLLHQPPAKYHSPVLRVNVKLLKLPDLMLILHLEGQLHESVFRTLPQDILRIASPKRQIHRTKYNGLARSGLTGQDVKPVPEFHLYLINQCQILHM